MSFLINAESNVESVRLALARVTRMRTGRIRKFDAVLAFAGQWYGRIGDRWTSSGVQWRNGLPFVGTFLGHVHYHTNTVEALALLGLISKEDAAAHLSWARERIDASVWKDEEQQLQELSTKHGYRLVKTVERKRAKSA